MDQYDEILEMWKALLEEERQELKRREAVVEKMMCEMIGCEE